jgi:hypothetical protein
VISLISFDVKGAYNGEFKERLLQKLEAGDMPQWLVRWVGVFCSNRTASIVVNGHTSEQWELPKAGLSQGSPLSPVQFLFFNAGLVQSRISSKGGLIAFANDYSAWVTKLSGPGLCVRRDTEGYGSRQSRCSDHLEQQANATSRCRIVIHPVRLSRVDV